MDMMLLDDRFTVPNDFHPVPLWTALEGPPCVPLTSFVYPCPSPPHTTFFLRDTRFTLPLNFVSPCHSSYYRDTHFVLSLALLHVYFQPLMASCSSCYWTMQGNLYAQHPTPTDVTLAGLVSFPPRYFLLPSHVYDWGSSLLTWVCFFVDSRRFL
jgi:hypothetical protein